MTNTTPGFARHLGLVGIACLVCLGAGCQTKPSGAPAYSPEGPAWDLSQTGFIEELAFAQATARTPHFNDYTRDSYHVHKGDLIEGVAAFRSARNIPVLAVLAMGPIGDQRQYHLVAVLEVPEDPALVRVNEVVVRQARITAKFTATRRRKDIDPLLDETGASDLLRSGYPAKQLLYPEQSNLSVHFAMADWRNPEPVIRHGDPTALQAPSDEVAAFWRNVGALLDGMTLTYATHLPQSYLYPDAGEDSATE